MTAVRQGRLMREPRDWQAVAYLILAPLLVVVQWRHGFNLLAYALLLLLSVGIAAAHHNHMHRRMWHGRRLNRLTDLVLTVWQGHPSLAFHAAHNSNHHRYHHGPGDIAATWRFAGGDSNHLIGYLLHPFQALTVLYPHMIRWLLRARRHRPALWRHCLMQYAVLIVFWTGILWLDWQKALLFVIVPQLHGLHWLLGTNYLQHAHADGHSPINFARNFEGAVNLLMFNIGLHTAHHRYPRVHWSRLPALHEALRPRIHPDLLPGGLAGYIARTYLLAPFLPRYRSRSLMRATRPETMNESMLESR